MMSSKGYALREIIPDIVNLLTLEEVDIIERTHRIIKYKKGRNIHSDGEKPEYLMCLIEGKIKIFKEGVCGRTQIVRMMKPVQYFGYRAYIAEENYNTTAGAFENAVVCQIPMSVIINIMKTNSNLSYFFLKMMSKELGASDEKSVSLTQKHIRGRLAEAILFLLDNYGLESDGYTINIYLSREDLANLSNMTTSNAIRTLGTLTTEGLIAVDGRKIMILDEEHLRKVSRFG